MAEHLLNSLSVLLMLISLTSLGLSAPVTDIDTLAGQEKWLQRYHYLQQRSIRASLSYPNGRNYTYFDFAAAVRDMQRFLGLLVTGIVDEVTKSYMKKGRCGLPDIIISNRRKKRYDLEGSSYPPGTTLTYRINNYHNLLPKELQDSIFEEAFSRWSRVANINFQQVEDAYSSVDIDILFASGLHGDGAPFDGRLGTLAHTYFPQYGGAQHYDADEEWSHASYLGTNLLATAIHETGHSLGLMHSNMKESVMFPFSLPYDPNFDLSKDDIDGIQKIYGPAETSSTIFTTATTKSTLSSSTTATIPTSTKSTTASTKSTLSSSTTATVPTSTKSTTASTKSTSSSSTTATVPTSTNSTTATTTSTSSSSTTATVPTSTNSTVKAFQSTTLPVTQNPSFIWITALRYDILSSTRQTTDLSPHNSYADCMDGPIDAITQTQDGCTYIFKENAVYKISDDGIADGYPVTVYHLQQGFPPMTGKIDAALYWPTTGQTFLFKDYYVAEFNNRQFIRYHYITDILHTSIRNIDAAFYWPRNGKTYITQGDSYWRFETGSGTPDSDYPQSMSAWQMPGGVDAAFEYSNGRTYFFKGGNYYRFDDDNFRLDEGYPRPLKSSWFGCRSL